MDGYQLLIRFIIGGSVVLLATVLADVSKNPYVTGVAMCFPALLFAGSLALMLAGHPPDFISRYFVGSLRGIIITIFFVLTASALVRNFGFWPGVGMALGVWLVLASLTVVATLRFKI